MSLKDQGKSIMATWRRVNSGEPGQGIQACMRVFLWFAGTTGLALTEKTRVLVHPTPVKNEYEIADALAPAGKRQARADVLELRQSWPSLLDVPRSERQRKREVVGQRPHEGSLQSTQSGQRGTRPTKTLCRTPHQEIGTMASGEERSTRSTPGACKSKGQKAHATCAPPRRRGPIR